MGSHRSRQETQSLWQVEYIIKQVFLFSKFAFSWILPQNSEGLNVVKLTVKE